MSRDAVGERSGALDVVGVPVAPSGDWGATVPAGRRVPSARVGPHALGGRAVGALALVAGGGLLNL
jgi:hypothetical protein